MLIRALIVLPIILLAACETDGRPVAAPTGITANMVNGSIVGGGADPGYTGRGSAYTFGRRSR